MSPSTFLSLLFVALPASVLWHPYLGLYEAGAMLLTLGVTTLVTALLFERLRKGATRLSLVLALLSGVLLSCALPWCWWPMHPVALVLGATSHALALSRLVARAWKLRTLRGFDVLRVMGPLLVGIAVGGAALVWARRYESAELNTSSVHVEAASPSGQWVAYVAAPRFSLDVNHIQRSGPTLRVRRRGTKQESVSHQGGIFSRTWRYEIAGVRWESEDAFVVEAWLVPGDARTLWGWWTRASQPWRARREYHVCRWKASARMTEKTGGSVVCERSVKDGYTMYQGL